MPSDTDEYSIPRRGSALQLAYFVNCEPETLNAAILGDTDGPTSIRWRSPTAESGFAEYKDRDFLQAVGQGSLESELAAWWPASGPRWDALGVVNGTGMVILVEAKANVPEVANGSGCDAGSSGSERGQANRKKIERAMEQTRQHFGVSHESATAWTDTHCYQYANRLAHLCFFEHHRVPARLAHVYFTGDSTHMPTMSPEFDVQRASDAAALGLDAVTITSADGVYLPAGPDAYEKLRAHVA